MPQIEILGWSLAVILGLMTALWLLSLKLRDASIVDIFWGTGFVVTAWLVFWLTPGGALPRKLLISGLVTVWGLRLSFFIFNRNHGKGEDFRYQQWRQEHGSRWWWKSFFNVFLLQGVIMWLVAAPLTAAQASAQSGSLQALDYIGALVWAFGFYFEAVGDWQLTRFKADPSNRGKLLTSGVWRYTRHPNYFGDAAQWWGFFLIAASAGGWWTLFSPLLMTFLLVRVSGVAMLEKSLKDSKPGYAEYVRSTSAFIPWPPRKST
jgi:steroid 5-alpha reductase family enzyme